MKKTTTPPNKQAAAAKHRTGGHNPLGKAAKLVLGDYLKDEREDMTGWVMDHPEAFEDELPFFLDRKSMSREERVGSKFADVVADTIDKRTVVFENQFGQLDSCHLGKAIEYLLGLKADIVVWVVEHERTEMIDRVTYLNQVSDYDAYLVVLEAVAIDGCACNAAGGQIKVVAGPPEFMALTRGKERNNKYLREQSLSCLGALICDEAAKTTSLRFKPLGNTVNYLRAPTAHPEIKYEIAITTDTTTAGLFITSKTPGRADAIYNHLHRRKTRIERALGTKLDWDKDKPKRGHKISTDSPWDPRRLSTFERG